MKFSVTIGIKKCLCVLFAAVSAFSLFWFSQTARAGIKSGLLLCFNSVIPSLFLFTVLAIFISKTGVAEGIGLFLEPLSRRLFHLDGRQTAIMLVSLISGFPVGARLINGMYREKQIDIKTANTMLLYCVNAGPAFIITAVGQMVLGSASDGKRLLIAHVLSTVILAVIFGRILPKVRPQKSSEKPEFTMPLGNVFVQSVTEAAKTMLNICAFVVVFSSVSAVVQKAGLPHAVTKTVCGLLEVTVGVQTLTRNQLPTVAFLLGFGGFSVIFQVMAAAGDIKPSFLKLVASRLLHAFFSSTFIKVFEALWPRTLKTMSAGVQISGAAVNTSPFAAMALVFLSVVLVLFIDSSKRCERTVENFKTV